MNQKAFFILLLVCSLILPTAAYIPSSMQVEGVVTSELSGIKVAIFNGSTTEISESCKNASAAMFGWMDTDVEYIDESDIMDNKLYNFDILIFPPGNLPEYSVKLRSEGKEKIREYLRNGGSYIGISRGAHFACEIADVYGTESEWGLNIFNGTGYGPVGGFLEQNMYEVNINKSQSVVDLSDLPDSLTMMGWESIMFLPENNAPLNVIAEYETYGHPAMISYEYGQGAVFLSGVHPEFEEDDDRDNTAYFDHHEDPETDWPLMEIVGEWLVETSTWNNVSIDAILHPDATSNTTLTNTTSGDNLLPLDYLVLVGGIGAVIIVIAVLLLVKKRV